MKILTRPELVVAPNSATPAERSIEKRRLRKHAVLNEIRIHGPLSRADISKSLGYNLPSVSSLVDELVADGLVLEEQARAIPRGRRPIPVLLNENAAAVLGIDLGRTSTIGLLLNLRGRVLVRFERKTPSLKTVKAHANWAIDVAEKILLKSGDALPPLAGIGVALPGLVMKGHASKSAPQNLSETIQGELRERFGVPAFVENDARMMALGSLWFGAGRDFTDFIVVNIGHGIGMGVVVNGRILNGKQGFAGELGYLPLGDPGIDGYLDRPRALENVASGAGLIRKAALVGIQVDDASQLADLARKGSAAARRVFDEFAEALGLGIAAAMNIFDPQAVILSGRVCRSSDLFFNKMRETTRVHALPPIWETTNIQLSTLDVDLGPLGAGASVLHQIFHNEHVGVDDVI